MSATWPGSLPDKFFGELQWSAQESVVRTQMDSGPDQVRRRFTRPVKRLTHEMQLSGLQLAIFEAWFDGADLAGGANSFSWRNPVSGGAATFRFMRRPAWRALVSGPPSSAVWIATFELELMP